MKTKDNIDSVYLSAKDINDINSAIKNNKIVEGRDVRTLSPFRILAINSMWAIVLYLGDTVPEDKLTMNIISYNIC